MSPESAAVAALAAVPLFGTLDRARLARLAAGSTVRTVGTGQVVAVRGQPATRLIVVETGALSAAHDTVHGRRLRLGEFAAPCAVDKAAVLDGSGYTATWTASTRSRLRLLPSRCLLDLVDDVPAARRHVLAHLSARLRAQQDNLADACFADATTRVAHWLVRTAARLGTSRIVLPGAQQGLAEAVGVTRVSVNRALAALARAGLVGVEPGAVTILAPELLARHASGDRPAG